MQNILQVPAPPMWEFAVLVYFILNQMCLDFGLLVRQNKTNKDITLDFFLIFYLSINESRKLLFDW